MKSRLVSLRLRSRATSREKTPALSLAAFGALLAAFPILSIVGCSTARRGEPLAPAFAPTDPVLAQGQKVFYAQCHACHPHGQGGLGPALNNKPLPGFLMKFQVRHGLGTMPSFDAEKLPADDLDALVRYLKAMRARPAPPSG